MNDGLYDFEDLFRFPWELSEELDLVRHRWQNLHNQVIGRGISPRSDIDSQIQDKIHKDYSEFRYWETNLGFGQRFTASYNDELDNYKKLLIDDLKLVTDWLKANLPSETVPVPVEPEENKLLPLLSWRDLLFYGAALGVGGYVTYKVLKASK